MRDNEPDDCGAEWQSDMVALLDKHFAAHGINGMVTDWIVVAAIKAVGNDNELDTTIFIGPGSVDQPDYVSKGLLIDALDTVRESGRPVERDVD